jgi:predicted acyl esterase
MRIHWDLPVPMDDGVELRADVFLPDDGPGELAGPGAWPALLSCGPYGKGLAFQDGYPTAWQTLVGEHPEVLEGSTGRYQNWEVVDPEKWVVEGYAVVRVDSRGCGRSPGRVDHFSRREVDDHVACIAWAAAQQWCDGAVGLSGVSYYAMAQWQVAARRPPALKALCIWEGAADFYRDATHHGGVLSTFWEHWYDKQVKGVQHGRGEHGPRHPVTGLAACGPETLTEAELAANRVDFGAEIRAHPFLDDYHRERTAVWSDIEVPLLSSGNWGGQGLHLRGNVEGYLAAGSPRKWLELHGLEHWTTYYTDHGTAIQLAFFDHVLKGRDNGWDRRPAIQLQVRQVDGTFTERFEEAWPLVGTSWERLHLQAGGTDGVLVPGEPATGQVRFDPAGDGATFHADPVDRATEITGPLSARLWVSTTAAEADLFLALRVLDPQGAEVTFTGAVDPRAPATLGWLRLSHRELDTGRSLPHRPVHTHSGPAPVRAGECYEVEVELWPTCVVLPPGYRLALTVRGRDYENDVAGGATMSNFKNVLRGCGPFLHDDPLDRAAARLAGLTTLHCGPGTPSSLLVPVVPAHR